VQRLGQAAFVAGPVKEKVGEVREMIERRELQRTACGVPPRQIKPKNEVVRNGKARIRPRLRGARQRVKNNGRQDEDGGTRNLIAASAPVLNIWTYPSNRFRLCRKLNRRLCRGRVQC